MTTTELITIETLKAADVFKPGAVEKLISDVEQKARKLNADIDASTEAGRKQAVALAFRVTRSKTALDEMGKNHVTELKKAAGVVDADRRVIRERFDALRDEVRKPVDEYEAAEAGRIALHTHWMERLQTLDTFAIGQETIQEIDSRLLLLMDLRQRQWEEFSDGASRLVARMETSLPALRAKIVKQQEEQAELDRLRKAEAERQEQERRANAERERKERDERIATQIKATAIEAERQRVAQAIAAATAARLKREANTKHLAKINNAALADLVKVAGVTERIGKAIIVAIASGKVSHVKIEY